jgi:hypothetical protein
MDLYTADDQAADVVKERVSVMDGGSGERGEHDA